MIDRILVLPMYANHGEENNDPCSQNRLSVMYQALMH